MRLYLAEIHQAGGKRLFMVRAQAVALAWKKVDQFLTDEPFDRMQAKPYHIHKVASVVGDVAEVRGVQLTDGR